MEKIGSPRIHVQGKDVFLVRDGGREVCFKGEGLGKGVVDTI